MKHYIIFFLIVASLPQVALGQSTEAGKQKVIKNITETTDFQIYLVDTGRVAITFKVEYKSDEGTFKITEPNGTNTDGIKLYEPLQLDVFTDKLNTYLHTNKNVANRADNSSVYKIFQSLRSMAYGESDAPASGVLYLNQYIWVSTNLDLPYEIRKRYVDSIANDIYDKKIKVESSKEKLKNLLESNVDKNINISLRGNTLSKSDIKTIIDNDPGKLKEIFGANNITLLITGDATNKMMDSIYEVISIIQQDNTDYSQALANEKLAGVYKIKDVQFQFERGFLERVQVNSDFEGGQIFENTYAIGFSSPGNYQILHKMKLFIRNSSDKRNSAPHIFLSDVIQNYDNFLQNYTRDYSPGDTAFKIDPVKEPQFTLHKDRIVNLFETKAFTDLIGVGANNPNGLIQIQIDRRFNLLTNRLQLGGGRSDWGYFNYLNLIVNASKLENKERRLILRNQRVVDNNAVVSPSYATNMDFLRYENISIRIETNALLLDFPEAKFTFNVDLGAKYGYTPVIDSVLTIDSATSTVKNPVVANNFDAHTFTVYPKFWFEFFSERRFGMTIGYQVNTTWLFSNNLFKQVLSYSGKGGDLSTKPLNYGARFTHEIELTGRIDPNPKDNNGKIFVVARFFLQNHDVNTFYSQIQIGYAYNLVFKK